MDPKLWYVVDMATPERLKAAGSTGHANKEEAVKQAESYRDEYGWYWDFPY